MKPLSADQVLSLWERAEGGDALDHTLAILTGPLGFEAASAEALPLGERDRRILALQDQVFGAVLHASCRCPRCAEQLTFDLPTADLRSSGTAAEEAVLESGDLTIRFRLPNSGDIRAASSCADVASARGVLVERCVVQVARGGETVDVSMLGEADVERLAEHMAACDPQVETVLNVRCPACELDWEAVIDMGEFFWTELVDLGGRLVREVEVLARAFHWSEADILAMTPRRRRWYLELAEA